MSSAEALVGDRPDTPATSYRLLPSYRTVTIAAALAVVAGTAWLVTVRQAGSMSKMVNGLGQVGQRMPNDMGILAFLGMWSVMMIAMMAPAVVPAVLAHRLVARRRGESAAASAAFVGGFLAVWSLIGAAYLLPFLWFRGLSAEVGDSWWLPVLAGAVVVFAGFYQFTHRKAHCQQACCAPVTLVLGHDAGVGTTAGFRTGARHGVHCLGCCWALMAVLLVVGLMNLVWMIALSVLFLAEKHWRKGLVVGRAVGVALVILGFSMMVSPSLLHALSGASAKVSPDTMEMP